MDFRKHIRLGRYPAAVVAAVLAAAFALSGCIRDPFDKRNPGPGEEGNITVTFALPQGFGSTTATRNSGNMGTGLINENALDDLTLVIFNAGTTNIITSMPITISSLVDAGDYKTFKMGILPAESVTATTPLKFVLLANRSLMQPYTAPANSRQNSNITLDKTEAEFWRDNNIYRYMPRRPHNIPMWGEAEGTYTIDELNNNTKQVPTIHLIRAFAKVEIKTDPALATEFTLKQSYPVNSYKKFKEGPWSNDNSPVLNYSHAKRSVTAVSLANNSSQNTLSIIGNSDSASLDTTNSNIDNADKANRVWYLPEHDNTAVTSDKELFFIIKGDYTPAGSAGVDNFYKVRLLDDDGDLFDILRNHHYIVTIKNVFGPGYSTPEDAMASNIYLDAKVTEWNEVANDIVFDGTHYLEVSHPSLNLSREAGWVEIDLETNFPGIGNKFGIGIDNLPAGIYIDYCDPSLTWSNVLPDNMPGHNGELSRRIKVSWNEWTGQASVPASDDALIVRAGNMTYHIKLTRTDQPWISVPEWTRVPLDGMFHEVTPVVSTCDWDVSTTGNDEWMNLVTQSSEQNSDKVIFRTHNKPSFVGTRVAQLVFTNDDYHFAPVKSWVFLGPELPGLPAPGVKLLMEGIPAPENILAVNNIGQLNLDGQKYVQNPGNTGITHNYMVYFKYGSLVAMADADGIQTGYTNRDVVWAPQGYDYGALDNDYNSVPYYNGNMVDLANAPAIAAGHGDPCALASVGGRLSSKWRTPMSDDRYERTPPFGIDVPDTSENGAMGRRVPHDGQFYPYGGIYMLGLIVHNTENVSSGNYRSEVSNRVMHFNNQSQSIAVTNIAVEVGLNVRCVTNATPPKEGAKAPEGMLAVNNLGELNLDGQTKIGQGGITSNHLVYFKNGSLVAISGTTDTTTPYARDYDPGDIAWVPEGFDVHAARAASPDYPSLYQYLWIPYSNDPVDEITPNPVIGLGDPCAFAKKNGQTGGWRMPKGQLADNLLTADPTVIHELLAKDNSGNFFYDWEYNSGLNIYGRRSTFDDYFYPAAGQRNNNGILEEFGVKGYVASTAFSFPYRFTSSTVDHVDPRVYTVGLPKGYAYPVRCTPDISVGPHDSSTLVPVSDDGGMTEPLEIDVPAPFANLTWTATLTMDTTPHTRGSATVSLVQHQAELVDEDGNSFDASQPQPISKKFRVKFPKLYYPNRQIPVNAKVTITIGGTTHSFTVRQQTLEPEDVIVHNFREGASHGSINTTTTALDAAYVGAYRNALWNSSILNIPIGVHPYPSVDNYAVGSTGHLPANHKVTTSINTSTPKDVNYLHVAINDVGTGSPANSFNWTTVNNWKSAHPDGMLVLCGHAGAGLPVLMTKTDSPLYHAGYRGTAVHASAAVGLGGGKIATSTRKVYQYLTSKSPVATDRIFNPTAEMSTGTGFYNDGLNFHFRADQLPATAVVLVTNNTNINNGCATTIIDVENQILIMGETEHFNYGDGSGQASYLPAGHRKFLNNIVRFVKNTAAYGTHFTDLLLEGDDGTAPFLRPDNLVAQPAPWSDTYWASNADN